MYIASSIKAPFKIGLSPSFLNFLITFAGAFPLSEIIIVVFPFKCSLSSPKSTPESSIARFRNVFLTTDSFTSELKHSLLSLLV